MILPAAQPGEAAQLRAPAPAAAVDFHGGALDVVFCNAAILPTRRATTTSGPTRTIRRRARHDLHNRIPLRRQAVPDDVVGRLMFSASTESAYVMGQALVVDGGYSGMTDHRA